MSASFRFRLTMRKGPLPGKAFDLAKSLFTIGREVKNDIVINDAEVSRQHVRLTERPDGYWVEDLASTNGTFVNGQRLTGPVALHSGDILGLGSTVELEYGIPAGPEQTVIAGQSPAEAAPGPGALPVNEPVNVSPPPAMAAARPDPAPFSGPSPSPAPAAPSFSLPPSAAPAAGSSAGGFQVQPWMWAVGVGCALLALCGCGLVILVAVLGPQLGNLF
jgi:predicted component of type VI protein secretion system